MAAKDYIIDPIRVSQDALFMVAARDIFKKIKAAYPPTADSGFAGAYPPTADSLAPGTKNARQPHGWGRSNFIYIV